MRVRIFFFTCCASKHTHEKLGERKILQKKDRAPTAENAHSPPALEVHSLPALQAHSPPAAARRAFHKRKVALSNTVQSGPSPASLANPSSPPPTYHLPLPLPSLCSSR